MLNFRQSSDYVPGVGLTTVLGVHVTVLDSLMQNAESDIDLLRKLDSQGDDFAVPRDVEFMLRCPSAEKADLAADFINDYQFGVAATQESDGEHQVVVVVNMPIQQHAILSVSGFMVCIGELFGLECDGWGCIVQKQHP
ncbi:ribonuclease E inhibitor RraB [Novilysobacter antarcticus]|uniref:ribonuclease E inhibitor RraB n=1 Tax=Novilysobacter antarcticus TaxID=2862543 RepID=UPI001C993589|nr:ribonuclease E inhibitor RraB [Lysobacter antarcticus]